MKTETGAGAASAEAAGGAEGSALAAARRGRGLEPRSLVRPGAAIVLFLCALLFIPSIFSLYYVDAWTQVAIYSIVTLGLGVLVGRVGMVSLGQGAVLAMGAWVSARLLFATGLPFPVILLLGGLITMVLGTLVGLPALRMSGLYLALITLMLAGAITVALATINFPNGGHGFTGYNGSTVHIPPIRRPSVATTDLAFFRYSMIVAALMFVLVLVHLRGRPGRAWAAIRQSEAASLAGGINTTLYKLWAFALASFITGVAGGLVAGSYRYLNSLTFSTADSITLLAVVLMGGAYSLSGAVVAAFLLKFLQALLNDWGVSPDWLTILFGIGVLQVLTTAPRGIVDQMPKDIARLGRLIRGLSARPKAPPSGAADRSPKAPPSGAADRSPKAPPSGAADRSPKAPPSGAADRSPKAPPSGAADRSPTAAREGES